MYLILLSPIIRNASFIPSLFGVNIDGIYIFPAPILKIVLQQQALG
jgi:hypothetical protein